MHSNKLLLDSKVQFIIQAREVEKAAASEQVLALAVVTMEAYRLTLPPGIYCFGAVTRNGKPTGKIAEQKLAHASPAHEKALGTIFGFWPDGFGDRTFTREDLSVKHPPVMEVNELTLAPEPFLISLKEHAARKMAFMTNRFTRKTHPAPLELVARAQEALVVYARMSPPGVYRFYAEMADGRRTGRITEERRDFKDKTQEEECGGKAFGFWPLGYDPQAFDSNPFLQLFKDWPRSRASPGCTRRPTSFWRT